jgi:hypothetical protein
MSNKDITIKMPAQIATGTYRVGIVDGKTHEVKYMSPWRKNLILNSGLSSVAYRPWMECIRYCYAGYGTDPNYLDSGTTTADSDNAGAVTLTGGSVDLTSAVAGDSILWDTGEQGRIMSIGTPTACVISTEYAAPGGIAAGQFTILYTSRAKLTGNVPGGAVLATSPGAANLNLAGAPNQMVNYAHSANSSIVTNRQTYDFPVVTNVAGETYGEIGLSWGQMTGSGPWTPANQPVLFSRIVIPGTLHLDQGDYLRVVYQLSLTIAPTGTTSTAMAIDNIGSPETWDGDSKLYNLGLSIINVGNTSLGTNYTSLDGYGNEPCVASSGWIDHPNSYTFWVSYEQGAHSGSFPTGAPGTYWNDYVMPTLVANAVRNLYQSGLTYSQEKYASWAIGEANTSAIKAMGFGIRNSGASTKPNITAYIINIFDAGHPKLNTQTLTLKIKYSWSRTLTID